MGLNENCIYLSLSSCIEETITLYVKLSYICSYNSSSVVFILAVFTVHVRDVYGKLYNYKDGIGVFNLSLM